MAMSLRILTAAVLALLVGYARASAQTCVRHSDSEGCHLAPQQCFPVASGPSVWQDVGGFRTWQYRRAVQSPLDTCTPVPLGDAIPTCPSVSGCTGNVPPAGGPPPTVSIRIVGTRVFIDYDAPNLYCTNAG